MQQHIHELCRTLRLGNFISENYQNIEAESHEEFLVKLLRETVEERERKRKNRYLQQAHFDLLKDFSDFDFSHLTLPSFLSPDDLLKGDFVKKKQNLILYGKPGTGKTHLAIALGVEACKRGQKVLFYKTSRLVNHLLEAKQEGKLQKFWKTLMGTDLLILDEWGYIPFERSGTQLLFEVVSDCYEKRSVILTTNLSFDEWNTIFYDEKLTAAMLDRLVHHGLLIIHDGPSYRLTHSSMQ